MKKIWILFFIAFFISEIISCQNKAGNSGAGLLFVNGKMIKSVSLSPDHNSYYVSVKDGKIYEEKIPAEIIK